MAVWSQSGHLSIPARLQLALLLGRELIGTEFDIDLLQSAFSVPAMRVLATEPGAFGICTFSIDRLDGSSKSGITFFARRTSRRIPIHASPFTGRPIFGSGCSSSDCNEKN